MSLTFVCLECRKSYRRGGLCPHCGATLHRTDDVPRRHKTREWHALRRRILRWETGVERDFRERMNAVDTGYDRIKRQQRQFKVFPEVREIRKAARKARHHHKKLKNTLCRIEPGRRCCQ